MRKILFISKYLSTNKNGFESRLSVLINLFKRNNFQVSAITSSGSLKKFKFKNNYGHKKIDDVDYFFIKENIDHSSYSFKRIYSWIKFELGVFSFNYKKIGFKPDIIYISSLSLFTILNGIYLKKKFKAKLVFEMRDFWPYLLYSNGKFSKFNPLIIILGIIEKYGIYQSDLIISLIPRIRPYLKYRGFSNKNAFASTFPVKKNFFLIKKFFKINLNKKKFNICYAGNFGFDNYLDNLLNLISKVKSKLFVFHFFGNGSQKEIIKKNFSHLDNVKFYEYVDHNDLHSVLTRMDSLVVSFGFNDKYPLFGYELNKLNNYIMATKPILVVGKKGNLLKNRGKFIFVNKNNSIIFEKKLLFIKMKYNFFLKVAKMNKKKLLIRNNPTVIFNETAKHLKNL
ncbi:hypothetical protein OAM73_03200 [Candidatus Pelagibacter sp.]|nr:hypothetical protein [Candidatus Pelagibacter sp.]